MIKTIGKLTLVAILAAMAVGVPVRASAQDKTPDTSAPAPNAKPKSTRFAGKLTAVDKVAKTITVENKTKKRVIAITSETKLLKGGKAATLDEAVVGDEASGTYFSESADKMVAKVVHLGPRPEMKSTSTEKKAPAAN